MILDKAPVEQFMEAFSKGLYAHVADIDTDDYRYMFSVTNNIEGPPWNIEPSDGVVPVRNDVPMRSTSVGDIVAHKGRLLVIGAFRDIGPIPE